MRILAYPAFKNRDVNPYTSLLYSNIMDLGECVIEYNKKSNRIEYCDVFHFHWPEAFFKKKSRFRALKSIVKAFFIFSKMRRRGVKIFWTIHNLKPHEQRYPFLQRLYWRGMTKRLHGVIALSEGGLQLAREHLPAIVNIPSFVIPHGHYRDEYPNAVSRLEARRKLSLPDSAVVVGHTGLIRPYKNIPQLIRAFRGIERPDTVLLVGGKPMRKEFEPEVRAAASGGERIHLFLRWIADDELQHFLNAADLMVFPYTDILNSGSALLALSFDRPVLVPRLGAMAELQSAIGVDWVRTYDGELSAAVLNDAINWTLTAKRGQRAPLDALDWPSIARQTIDAYRTAVDSKAG